VHLASTTRHFCGGLREVSGLAPSEHLQIARNACAKKYLVA
jgi:hypothetical protein